MNIEGISRLEPTPVSANTMRRESLSRGASTLHTGLALAWRGKTILAVFTLIGICIASAYALLATPVYQSTATLILQPSRTIDNKGLDTPPGDLDLIRVDSELSIIKSERLLSYVFEELHLAEKAQPAATPGTEIDNGSRSLLGIFSWFSRSSGAAGNEASSAQSQSSAQRAAYEAFAARVSAARIGQSFVIAITYSSPDAQESARNANALASAYLLQSIESKYKLAMAGGEVLQGRLQTLAGEVDTATQAVASGTLPEKPTPDADARVIGAPQIPLQPSSPKKRIAIAFGAVLGLALGIVFITLRAVFDKRVRDAKALAEETGIPTLGTLPIALTDAGIARHSTPHAAFNTLQPDERARSIAAIRDLRTTIELTSRSTRRTGNLILAVAGCDDQASGLQIAAGLSELINRGGRNATVLFDNDPWQGVVVGSPAPPSLADAVINSKSLTDSVLRSNTEIMTIPIHSPIEDINLYADFQSPAAKRVMDVIANHGDLIMALPSLSKSAIGLALATYADAVIIVAIADKSTKDDVLETYHRFHRAGANVIGTVVGTPDA